MLVAGSAYRTNAQVFEQTVVLAATHDDLADFVPSGVDSESNEREFRLPLLLVKKRQAKVCDLDQTLYNRAIGQIGHDDQILEHAVAWEIKAS